MEKDEKAFNNAISLRAYAYEVPRIGLKSNIAKELYLQGYVDGMKAEAEARAKYANEKFERMVKDFKSFIELNKENSRLRAENADIKDKKIKEFMAGKTAREIEMIFTKGEG